MNYISGLFTPADPVAAAQKKVDAANEEVAAAQKKLDDANGELTKARAPMSGTISDGVQGGRRKKTRRGGLRKSRRSRK